MYLKLFEMLGGVEYLGVALDISGETEGNDIADYRVKYSARVAIRCNIITYTIW